MAALKEAGISTGSRGGADSTAVPLVATSTTHHLQRRTLGLLAWLTAAPSEQRLFDVACVFAEIVAEGRMKPGTAMKLVEGECAANGLKRQLGAEGVRQTCANAFRWIEEKQESAC